MPKFRDYFRQMLSENEVAFAKFMDIHTKYAADSAKWQEEYNLVGEGIVKIIHEWEQKLCGNQEKGDKAVFSAKLAEKFWGEVRAFFPLIDMVGVRIETKDKPHLRILKL